MKYEKDSLIEARGYFVLFLNLSAKSAKTSSIKEQECLEQEKNNPHATEHMLRTAHVAYCIHIAHFTYRD